MRATLAILSALALAAVAPAAPPALEVPAEVRATSEYVRFTPKTDAAGVLYVGLSGLDPFPSDELKDPRRFLLPVRGVPAGRYRFAAVAASATGEQVRADFAVVVGDVPPGPGPSPTPPGPTPTPTPPDVPPLPPDNPPEERNAFPAVRKAAGSLTQRQRVALATAHRRAVPAIDSVTTPAEATAAINAALADLDIAVTDELIVALGKALSSAVDYRSATLTDKDRTAIKDALRRIADSLEGK